jgi:hypothetical protein
MATFLVTLLLADDIKTCKVSRDYDCTDIAACLKQVAEFVELSHEEFGTGSDPLEVHVSVHGSATA